MNRLPRPQDRQRLLSARRNAKMAGSVHCFVRGSTEKFYKWLAEIKSGTLPDGPPVWICGDCHVGNLGPLGDTDGDINIEIRDFDQTVVGNPAHDMIRLGLSLATAVRDSNLPGKATSSVLEVMADTYAAAFDRPKVVKAPKCVRAALREASHRTWKRLADECIEDATPVIPLGKRFWPLSQEERAEITQIVENEQLRKLVTVLRSREDDASVTLLDAAYWVKGCSSLGRLRFAVVAGVGDPPFTGDSLCLLDIKEAVKPIAAREEKARLPRKNGARVVAGAQHLSPSLGERMLATEILRTSVFIRELLPQDLKLEIDEFSEEQANKVAAYLAGSVGRAHARQMDKRTRRKWGREIARTHSKAQGAPSWLWRSVVDLLAIHEAAYLEHCRTHVAPRSG